MLRIEPPCTVSITKPCFWTGSFCVYLLAETGQRCFQAISVAVPVVAGFLVSFLGQKELLTWYRGLNKPRWQPPAFLFGTVSHASLQCFQSQSNAVRVHEQ